jgi:2-polyprenyl-3-methyl-5-hydroxy-6-metoxy-1,4-benzoquinol methylase
MWDEKYSIDDYVYGTEPNDFLRHNYQAIPAGRVLCLGEGEGRNALFLAQQGYQVTAIDSSMVGLSKARKLAEENKVNIEFIHQDLAHYDPGLEQWEGIVSIFCHVPPAIRLPLHHKVVSALKQKGVLLLEAYTPAQLQFGTGGPPVTEMMMTSNSLRQELPGLIFHHVAELQREVVEGTGHSGLGAVVQLVAGKQEQ